MTTDWWTTAVVYQIYIRSFSDSNADGEGDLPGIKSKLDYLSQLGVDAIWITPFYPSPMADGGYDVADYCAVDPRFGTLEDFDSLVADAHRLDIRVIVDLVPNHTSIEHQWFRQAIEQGPESPQLSRYIVRTGRGDHGEYPPNNWVSEFGGPAWSPMPWTTATTGDWYLHLFAAEQPDLNWDNEDVRDSFDAVLTWWLGHGVDGFRIDVAHGLIKAAGLPDNPPAGPARRSTDYRPEGNQWHQPEVHDIYRRWRRVVEAHSGPETILTGEVWAPDLDNLMSYVAPDELHQVFTFDLLQCEWDASEFKTVIIGALEAASKVGTTPTWVLGNHDRDRQVTRYGGGEEGTRRARAAAMLMLSLPGSAYLYQGEELGLPDVQIRTADKQDPMYFRSNGLNEGRDGCRVPMPWTNQHPHLGFSDARQTWLPIPPEWARLAASVQVSDPLSTLALYTHALTLRKAQAGNMAQAVAWWEVGSGLLIAQMGNFLSVTNFGTDPWSPPKEASLLLASTGGSEAKVGPDSAAWFTLTGPLGVGSASAQLA